MNLSDVMTTGEAALIWKKNPDTIKHLCTGLSGKPPRLTDKECRKSGNAWLVTRSGMVRLYGDPPQ